MRPPSLLFSGYFGFGNTGDEAILQASVDLVRARLPEARITVLSAQPEMTAKTLGVAACPRAHPQHLFRALRGADTLVSGGGSLLQDTTSLHSLVYYLSVIRMALALRRRVVIFAQGIGPLRRPAARNMTREVLRRTHLITVRDPDSAALLRSLGAGGRGWPPLVETADPVFALTPERTDRVERLLAGAAGGARVGVSLRPWPGMGTAREAIGAALAGSREQVLLCPMQPVEDAPISVPLLEQLGERATLIEERLSPREWAAVLGSLDAVVGGRLHALILAAAAGVPTVGISYDPKVVSLQRQLGALDLGPPAAVTAERVRESLDAVLAAGSAAQEERRARAAELRRRAALNADLLAQLLRGEPIQAASRSSVAAAGAGGGR